jgi:L-cysteine:1D-myo-inositol 2-amino-2-deoxy-alpha-D-glucopyranoside ligase
MRLKVYNTMTRNKEDFTAQGRQVGIYVCGITPYDVTHLGHAFTYVFFDVVARYMRDQGSLVKYVQNLTDIDDDILKKASQLGKDWREVVSENAKLFLEDMRWLNNVQPDVFPRATDHIKDIIRTVESLITKDHGYERKGNVYFPVDSDRDYGKLSKLPREKMLPIANERGNNPDDPNKRNPLDFVLWQARKPGEPSWKSPWGEGRPGWHIECTAMSTRHLGPTVDIHGGGSDLIFPHHESSIAQSECLTGKPFVRYWMHTGMVRYQGEKMSKSLGNLVFIRTLRKNFRPNEVRLSILSHHYRSQWEFTDGEVEETRKRADLFKDVWRAESGTGEPLDHSGYEKAFLEAMEDDFDTPKAIRALEELAAEIRKSHGLDLSGAKAFMNRAFNILGLVMEYG